LVLGIGAGAAGSLIADYWPEESGPAQLGDARVSRIDGIPVPEQAERIEGEAGTLGGDALGIEELDAFVDGRVYDLPRAFSRRDVRGWYQDRNLEGNPWRAWAWCGVSEDGFGYHWALSTLGSQLSVMVLEDPRPDSPARDELVIVVGVRPLPPGDPAVPTPICAEVEALN